MDFIAMPIQCSTCAFRGMGDLHFVEPEHVQGQLGDHLVLVVVNAERLRCSSDP